MRYQLRLACCVAVLSMAVGCSNEPPPPEPVYPVSGRLTMNGQPIDGATVTFYNSASKRAAFGISDQDGNYQLTTFKTKDGAVAGDHQVSVSKTVAEAPPVVAPSIESGEYDPNNIPTDAAPVETAPQLPPRFADRNISGLTATVEPGGENRFDFELVP